MKHKNLLVISVVVSLLLSVLALVVWARINSPLVHTFKTPRTVDKIAISADNRLIAASQENGNILVWDAQDNTLLATLQGHRCIITALTFATEQNQLVSASGDGAVLFWTSPISGTYQVLIPPQPPPRAQHDRCRPSNTFSVDDTRTVWSLAIGAADRLLAVGQREGTITILDLHSGAPIHTLVGHPTNVDGQRGVIVRMVFDTAGAHLASTATDHTIHVWDIATGQLTTVLTNTGYIGAVRFVPNRTDLRAVTYSYVALQEWSLPAGQRQLLYDLKRFSASTTALSADSTLFALGGGRAIGVFAGAPLIGQDDPRIYLGSFDQRQIWHTLRGHTATVTNIVFSQDGHYLVSGSDDGTVRLWRVPEVAEEE
ncbi:hypothetical protein HC928_02085 [bacterium]|nr:hypothetical protein [bacterium]